MKKLFFLFICVFSFSVFSYDSVVITSNIRGIMYKENGGMSAFSYYVGKLGKYYWINNSNAFSPNVFVTCDDGKKVKEIYKKYGLKFNVPSNHDLEYKNLFSSFSWLASNLKAKEKKVKIDDYRIVYLNGVKIMFISYISPKIKNVLFKKYYENIEFLNVDYEEKVGKLRKKFKPDFVIFISNEFYDGFNILKNTDGIDFAFLTFPNAAGSSLKNIVEFKTDKGTAVFLQKKGFEDFFVLKAFKNKIAVSYVKMTKKNEKLENELRKYYEKFEKNFVKVKDNYEFLVKTSNFLRKKYKADVFIINKGNFEENAKSLNEFVRYDSLLSFVEVKGKEIKKLLNNEKIYVFGVENGKIFGKDIKDEFNYKALINNYLLYGGDGVKIDYTKLKENIAELKSVMLKNIKPIEAAKPYKKYYFERSDSISMNYSETDVSDKAKKFSNSSLNEEKSKESKFIYTQNLTREYEKFVLNNYTELRYETSDGETTTKYVKLNTKLDFENSISFYQKIKTSFLKTAISSNITDYMASIGKNVSKELYLGLSYQNSFPKKVNGAEKTGIYVNYSKSSSYKGVIITNQADYFYSRSQSVNYYESEFISDIKIPMNKNLYFEARFEKYLVYDENIGTGSNDKYFFGVNISLGKERFCE